MNIPLLSICDTDDPHVCNSSCLLESICCREGPYLCLEADPMLKHLVIVHGDPQIMRVIY